MSKDLFGNLKFTVKHLIRMIHFILGPDLFESSLVNYVDSFRCLNSNLENALNEFTRKAHSAEPKILPDFVVISDVIESWLHKTGIPLIIIKRNHEDRDITVTQVCFLILSFLQTKIIKLNL